MLELLDLPREWFPPALESGAVSGTTGAGVPVAAGGGDQAAGALGVGVDRPGSVSVALGTSGVVFGVLPALAADPRGTAHTFCHAVPGTWHAMGVMLSAGGALDWFHRSVVPGVPIEELLAAAAAWGPGCEGLQFAPYLSGERTPHADPDARGAFVGLTLRHDTGALTRAVLEGVAYGLRDSLELLRGLGLRPSVGRMGGGGSRSELWRRIVASTLDLPLEVTAADDAAALGAAMLARRRRRVVRRRGRGGRVVRPRRRPHRPRARLARALRRGVRRVRAALSGDRGPRGRRRVSPPRVGIGGAGYHLRMGAPRVTFRHEALLYAGEDEFVARVDPFVREGLAAGEAVMVAVSDRKIRRLRDALGPAADDVTFADMDEIGGNPGADHPRLARVRGAAPRGRRPVRGVGEPISAGRSADELVECQRHEDLLNVAFGSGPGWTLVCPYDTAALDAGRDRGVPVQPSARPRARRCSGEQPSTAGWRRSSAPFAPPLPEPDAIADELAFDVARLADVRRAVAEAAERANLDEDRAQDLVVAVHEVAAEQRAPRRRCRRACAPGTAAPA